jgi:hypothetical protein
MHAELAQPPRLPLDRTRRRAPGHPAFGQQLARPPLVSVGAEEGPSATSAANSALQPDQDPAEEGRAHTQHSQHLRAGAFVDFSKQLPRCARSTGVCGALHVCTSRPFGDMGSTGSHTASIRTRLLPTALVSAGQMLCVHNARQTQLHAPSWTHAPQMH